MTNLFGDGDSIRHLWEFPDTWLKLCNYCRLKHVAKFANEHEQVMTLYAALDVRQGLYPLRMQESSASIGVYVHPTTIRIAGGAISNSATTDHNRLIGSTLPVPLTFDFRLMNKDF